MNRNNVRLFSQKPVKIENPIASEKPVEPEVQKKDSKVSIVIYSLLLISIGVLIYALN